jgi:DNA mismatch repair ATPase MutS
MMQCGMFVLPSRAEPTPAKASSPKREEDATMESGKLDEEVSRMSAIANTITPSSVLLCNESFASTNEPEGCACRESHSA